MVSRIMPYILSRQRSRIYIDLATAMAAAVMVLVIEYTYYYNAFWRLALTDYGGTVAGV